MSNSWDREFETGLVDNFVATIESSTFGTDARYGSGEILVLKWELEGTDQDGNAVEESLLVPVGKGWESVDGGKTIQHESGKDRYFNKNSRVAQIIARCIKDFGLGATLQERGGPFEAKVWEGLTFRFKREEKDYGGDIGAKSFLMPVEFVGVKGEAKAGKSSASAPAAAAGGSDEKVLKAKLVALAKKSDSHAEFMEQALAIDGVTDSELLDAVVDENGIYAEANS